MAMQYLSTLNDGGYQDEANFVQSFAVQQQPFLGYPYLGGFQPFNANQLYSQFAPYSFGHPFVDPQYVGFQGADGMDPESMQTRTDLLMPGANVDGNLFPQLYQGLANMSLQDIQDQQQMLQQQLYQQQLLLQQQQLHQQLLRAQHQQQQHQQQQQQQQLQASEQAEAQSLEPAQLSHSTEQVAQTLEQQGPAAEVVKEVSQTEQKELQEELQEGQSTQPQPQQPSQTQSQKPKQDGPKSWADILSAPAKPAPPPAKKQGPTSPTINTPTTTTTTTTTTTSNTISTSPSGIGATSLASGSKTKATDKAERPEDNSHKIPLKVESDFQFMTHLPHFLGI